MTSFVIVIKTGNAGQINAANDAFVTLDFSQFSSQVGNVPGFDAINVDFRHFTCNIMFQMEYKPKKENLDAPANPGKHLPTGTKKQIERCLIDGKTVEETASLCSVNNGTVTSFRKKLMADGKLDYANWKKSMQTVLAEASMKAAERINDNIDNIPLSQLTLAMAIMTDKVHSMSDAPSAVVIPARLQISQDDLNKALGAFDKATKVIDITPEKNS